MRRKKPSMDEKQKRDFLQEIYEKYKNEMYYAAYGILHNSQDAEDVVHDTFMVLLTKLDNIKGEAPEWEWSYILTMVRNKAKTLYKYRQRLADKEVEDELLQNVLDEEPYRKVLDKEVQDFLFKVLKQMNKTYRDILIMQFYHEMSVTEIARIMGKSPDNIRHLSARARGKLKKLLVRYGVKDKNMVEEVERMIS